MTELSVAQLEKLLDTKRSVLSTLQKKRENLQKALASVESRIASVGGASSGASGKARRAQKRPRNDKTLQEVVFELLEKNKKGFRLADLSDKVLETGYKSGSAKFSNTVYQCLYNNQDRIVCDPATRCYRMK